LPIPELTTVISDARHWLFLHKAMQTVDERIALVVPEHIRFANVHGRIVLLDLREGEYSILDEVATFLWDLVLSGPKLGEAVAAFVEQFGVSSSQSRNDLEVFIEDCVSRRLLTTGTESTRQPRTMHLVSRPMNLFSAWSYLRAVKRSLRNRGFSETYKESMCLNPGIALTCERHSTLANALSRFRFAENGLAVSNADIDCLPRSLALHRFLLAGGVAVDHCIGVRRFPFGAHAWVELSGMPIYDSPTFVEGFTTIATISACSAS
jgi:hypothetical protein